MTTYATWNSADKNANIALSNGDLTALASNSSNKAARGTLGVSSGKWYWEVTVDSGDGDLEYFIGVGTGDATLDNVVGKDAYGYGYRNNDGNKWNDDSGGSYGSAYTTSVIGIALDMDNGKIWWRKDGTWQASGDPEAGTNEAFSGLSGTFYPMVSMYYSTNQVTANFGASALSGSVPSGFNTGLYDASVQTVEVGCVALTLTPNAVTVTNTLHTVSVGVVALTLTPKSTTVSLLKTVEVGCASLTLTPHSVGYSAAYAMGVVALTLTTHAPTIELGCAGRASVTFTARGPTVAFSASTPKASFTGNKPTVTFSAE